MRLSAAVKLPPSPPSEGPAGVVSADKVVADVKNRGAKKRTGVFRGEVTSCPETTGRKIRVKLGENSLAFITCFSCGLQV